MTQEIERNTNKSEVYVKKTIELTNHMGVVKWRRVLEGMHHSKYVFHHKIVLIHVKVREAYKKRVNEFYVSGITMTLAINSPDEVWKKRVMESVIQFFCF